MSVLGGGGLDFLRHHFFHVALYALLCALNKTMNKGFLHCSPWSGSLINHIHVDRLLQHVLHEVICNVGYKLLLSWYNRPMEGVRVPIVSWGCCSSAASPLTMVELKI
jgi:hypothetical protein